MHTSSGAVDQGAQVLEECIFCASHPQIHHSEGLAEPWE